MIYTESSKFVDFPGNAVLSVNVAVWDSKSSNFSHIPTNVAIWFSKCSDLADVPR